MVVMKADKSVGMKADWLAFRLVELKVALSVAKWVELLVDQKAVLMVDQKIALKVVLMVENCERIILHESAYSRF